MWCRGVSRSRTTRPLEEVKLIICSLSFTIIHIEYQDLAAMSKSLSLVGAFLCSLSQFVHLRFGSHWLGLICSGYGLCPCCPFRCCCPQLFHTLLRSVFGWLSILGTIVILSTHTHGVGSGVALVRFRVSAFLVLFPVYAVGLADTFRPNPGRAVMAAPPG